MNEFLKKGFFLGLGIAAASKEKVEKYVDELVTKGKLTPREAEEVIDSFIKKGEETEEKWNDRRKEKVQTFLDDFEIVKKEEFYRLQARVENLEQQLGNVTQTDLSKEEAKDEEKNEE